MTNKQKDTARKIMQSNFTGWTGLHVPLTKIILLEMDSELTHIIAQIGNSEYHYSNVLPHVLEKRFAKIAWYDENGKRHAIYD